LDNFGNFYVVTTNSTNTVGSVLRITTGIPIVTGSETTVTKTPPGTVVSEIGSENWTQVGTLVYNDATKNTLDGQHVNLTLNGILKTIHIDATSTFNSILGFEGTGSGNFKGKFVIVSGHFDGHVVGKSDFDDF